MNFSIDGSTRDGLHRSVARRWFLRDCGVGLGGIALHSLLGGSAHATTIDPLAPKRSHFAGKAKRVIFLFMGGAPSHVDLFENKPTLSRLDGTVPPAELLEGYRSAFIKPDNKLLGPKFEFAKFGNCGIELAKDLLPYTGSVADDITWVRSMQTDAFNHAPAQILMSTGSQQFGRPSLGAWTVYGLGSETENLPPFVVLSSGLKGPSGGSSNFGSGFLPSVTQGVPFNSIGDPVLFLSNPKGISKQSQRSAIDAINALNQKRFDAVADPEIQTRISAFEMAYRMQDIAPEVTDISRESQETLDLYGAKPGQSSFANNCLLARRLVEKGVRFVELFHESWDQHGNLVKDLQKNCRDTDQACAALVTDLKQRGMLDDTLVIWGGEFGRTPMVQGGNDGRDHHPNAFTMWMAGGGTKGGHIHGGTDDLGFNAVEKPVHVHDLNATILDLLGFDHEKLTFRSQGLDMRLTNVHGHVVKDLLA